MCTEWAEAYWRGTPGVVEHQHARDKGMGGGTYTDKAGCSAVEGEDRDEIAPVPATMSRHSHHMVRVCSAKSSTCTGCHGAGRVAARCREGSAVPLVEATRRVAPRERTTARCGHVLSMRRDLVDGLGCARGERDMRERGEGGGGRRGRASTSVQGREGRVAYMETTRLEGTTAASRPLHGVTSLPHLSVYFFLRRTQLEMALLGRGILGRCGLGENAKSNAVQLEHVT